MDCLWLLIFLFICPFSHFVLSHQRGNRGDSLLAFQDVIRQKSFGNRISQCPCVIHGASRQCVSYDSRYLATAVEEAILAFIDLSNYQYQPLVVNGGTFKCASLECQHCFAILFYRLQELGLVPRGYRTATRLLSRGQINRGMCPRFKFIHAPVIPPPPSRIPDYMQAMISAGQRNRQNQMSGGGSQSRNQQQQQSSNAAPPTSNRNNNNNNDEKTDRNQNHDRNNQQNHQHNHDSSSRSGNQGVQGNQRGGSQTVNAVSQQQFNSHHGRVFPDMSRQQPQFSHPPSRPGFSFRPQFPGSVPPTPQQPPIPSPSNPQLPHEPQPPPPVWQPPVELPAPPVQPQFPPPPQPQPLPQPLPNPPQWGQPSWNPSWSGNGQWPPQQQPPQYTDNSIPVGSTLGSSLGSLGNFLGSLLGGGGGGGGNGGNNHHHFIIGKRKKRETEMIGQRFTIGCTKRGEADGEYLSLCGSCWTWRELPADYFPRLVNELSCEEGDYCLSGWGECKQQYRNVDVLKRVAGRWVPTVITTSTCCDCRVKAGTEIHSLVVGDKPK